MNRSLFRPSSEPQQLRALPLRDKPSGHCSCTNELKSRAWEKKGPDSLRLVPPSSARLAAVPRPPAAAPSQSVAARFHEHPGKFRWWMLSAGDGRDVAEDTVEDPVAQRRIVLR